MYKKGLTLFEIIVATILLALIITGLVSVILAGKRYILHSRARMSGGELGKLFMDPLQMEVRQDTWINSCVGGNTNCPTTNQTIGGIAYTPSHISDNVAGTNLRRVKTTITWNE